MGGMYAAEEVGEVEPDTTLIPQSQPKVNDDTGEVIEAEVVENHKETEAPAEPESLI